MFKKNIIEREATFTMVNLFDDKKRNQHPDRVGNCNTCYMYYSTYISNYALNRPNSGTPALKRK